MQASISLPTHMFRVEVVFYLNNLFIYSIPFYGDYFVTQNECRTVGIALNKEIFQFPTVVDEKRGRCYSSLLGAINQNKTLYNQI